MTSKRYVLLGLAAYMTFLIASVPAALVWKGWLGLADQPQLEKMVSQLEGSVWEGKAHVSVEGQSHLITWSAVWRSLWRLRFELDLSSHREGVNIDATAFVSPFGLGLRGVRGKLSHAFINEYLKPMSASMTNPVFVNVNEIGWAWGAFSEAAGRITWEGGDVTYRAGRGKEESSVPSVAGLLTLQDEKLHLIFVIPSNKEELILAKLNSQGMGTLQVRRRLLDLVGQRWASNSQADDIIFEVSQPLWN